MRPFENIVKKGENTSYKHFLLFRLYFQKPSISNNKILHLSSFKIFADNSINVNKILKFFMERIKTLSEKMLGTRIFLYFSQCFEKTSFTRSLKFRIM